MRTMYPKRVYLKDDERKSLSKDLVIAGQSTDARERELENMKDSFKSQIDSKKSEIIEANTKRKDIQDLLAKDYRIVEVDSKSFVDGGLKKEIIIEVDPGNYSILEMKDLSQYRKLEIGFDSFNVILADSIKFKELLNQYPKVFTKFESAVSSELLPNEEYYVFNNKGDMRLVRLADGFDFLDMEAMIANYDASNKQPDAETQEGLPFGSDATEAKDFENAVNESDEFQPDEDDSDDELDDDDELEDDDESEVMRMTKSMKTMMKSLKIRQRN